MKNFGVERVTDPEHSIPAAAWCVDNSSRLRSKEIRIALHFIVAEEENLYQICGAADYKDTFVREKILKIVRERGKFHNPHTTSSGFLLGTVEEVSEDFEDCKLRPGDTVLSLSNAAGLPLYIESIESIDYNYNLIQCSGYAICFESTALIKYDEPIMTRRTKHFLRALSEEGSLQTIHEITANKKIRTAVIIGNSMPRTILYAQMLRSREPEVRIAAILESSCLNADIFNEVGLRTVFGSLVDEIYLDERKDPMHVVQNLKISGVVFPADIAVNAADNLWGETLSALLVKNGGIICPVNLRNGYTREILIADSLGKNIENQGWRSIGSQECRFAPEVAEKSEETLNRMDEYLQPQLTDGTHPLAKKMRSKKEEHEIDGFIYTSPVTAAVVDEILNIALYDCNVIIQGETGVGKEKVFNLINHSSSRKLKPCVKVNCATIQENLAESEFFGYEKGAFTGAQANGKEGYFEMADTGTLFLDEIGSLSLAMQSKLLRVLQEKSFYRVGGTQPKTVDVRVICANNVPLKKLVEEGKFREDLYYRLNICIIEVPPLRNRKEDIPCLAKAFIREYSRKYGIEKDFSDSASEQLEKYNWPGNVRELENTIHRLYIGERGHIIGADSVEELLNAAVYDENIVNLKKSFNRDESMDFNKIMEDQERRLIAYALKKEGTTRKAAEFLNIPQTTLARKKLKHNL